MFTRCGLVGRRGTLLGALFEIFDGECVHNGGQLFVFCTNVILVLKGLKPTWGVRAS